MSLIKLLAVGGDLRLPLVSPNAFGETDTILITEGPDSIPWPLKSEYRSDDEIVYGLFSALYDEVQMGQVPCNSEIALPDGRIFARFGSGPWGLDIDEAFAEAHNRGAKARKAIRFAAREY